jgi:AcrR family transcriptional regulator
VPKLWNETIEAHRRDVRDAILSTTAALVFEHGLLSVTMSQIAEATGIGRATLYKYFTDIDSILAAWHAREISIHLRGLAEIRDGAGEPEERLSAVLTQYADITRQTRGHLDTELVRLLHRGDYVAEAHNGLRELVVGLIEDAARGGSLRKDVSAVELADFCLHALSAAGGASSRAAVRRLVRVTLAGLRPDAPSTAP